jgi:hypothetical protein
VKLTSPGDEISSELARLRLEVQETGALFETAFSVVVYRAERQLSQQLLGFEFLIGVPRGGNGQNTSKGSSSGSWFYLTRTKSEHIPRLEVSICHGR